MDPKATTNNQKQMITDLLLQQATPQGDSTSSSDDELFGDSSSTGRSTELNLSAQLLVDNEGIVNTAAQRVRENPSYKEMLFKLVLASQSKSYTGHSAANAITYLNYGGVFFSSSNTNFPSLDKVSIPFADLSNCVLEDISLKNANLSDVNFSAAHIMGCDFTNSNLSGVNLGVKRIDWRNENNNLFHKFHTSEPTTLTYQRSKFVAVIDKTSHDEANISISFLNRLNNRKKLISVRATGCGGCMCSSPDDTLFSITSTTGNIKIWRTSDWSSAELRAGSFEIDKYCIEENFIHVLFLNSLSLSHSIKKLRFIPESLDYGPPYCLAIDYTSMHIFTAHAKARLLKIDLMSGAFLSKHAIQLTKAESIEKIEISPDGKYIGCISNAGSIFGYYYLPGFDLVHQIQLENISAAAFDSVSTLFAVATKQGYVHLGEVKTGKILGTIKNSEHSSYSSYKGTASISRIEFNLNSSKLLFFYGGGKGEIWDITNLKKLARLVKLSIPLSELDDIPKNRKLHEKLSKSVTYQKNVSKLLSSKKNDSHDSKTRIDNMLERNELMMDIFKEIWPLIISQGMINLNRPHININYSHNELIKCALDLKLKHDFFKYQSPNQEIQDRLSTLVTLAQTEEYNDDIVRNSSGGTSNRTTIHFGLNKFNLFGHAGSISDAKVVAIASKFLLLTIGREDGSLKCHYLEKAGKEFRSKVLWREFSASGLLLNGNRLSSAKNLPSLMVDLEHSNTEVTQ